MMLLWGMMLCDQPTTQQLCGAAARAGQVHGESSKLLHATQQLTTTAQSGVDYSAPVQDHLGMADDVSSWALMSSEQSMV